MTSVTPNSNLVLDREFYNDNNNMTALQAAQTAKGAGELFNHFYAERIQTGGQEMNGLQCVANGGRFKFQTDYDGDGNYEEMTAAEAMAQSFDSELDLYIEAQLGSMIAKYGNQFWNHTGFMNSKAIEELRAMGIQVDKVNDRTYSFSLVDENGNIIEDSEGGKGQILFGDWVIPDGYAQSTEINLSSMLDLMGYDCISKADFIGNGGEEKYQQVLAAVQANLNNGAYHAGTQKVADIYGGVKAVSGTPSGVHTYGAAFEGITNPITEGQHEENSALRQQITEAYTAALEEAKTEYKKEHGTEATGQALGRLETQAREQIIIKYGTEAIGYLN